MEIERTEQEEQVSENWFFLNSFTTAKFILLDSSPFYRSAKWQAFLKELFI